MLAGLLAFAMLLGPSEEAGMGAGEMFTALYKHVEPHAVTGVWLGGGQALRLVDAHREGHDEHGHALMFESSAEFREHYQPLYGSGYGFLVYNINTVQWIAAGVLLALLGWAGWRARKLAGSAPRGMLYSMLESVVLFVRDQMVYSILGKEEGRRLAPLFLTQFFFILFMNLFGLIPDFTGGLLGTATANLAVTGGLALTTFVWIHFSGLRHHGLVRHWGNFIPHGVPIFVLPIIVPVEIVGMLVKPVALMVRLFANMLAGHLVILSFFGLAFYFGTWFVAPLPLAMAIGISALELFVAFLQAYVFTYLSIIFIGAAVHPEH